MARSAKQIARSLMAAGWSKKSAAERAIMIAASEATAEHLAASTASRPVRAELHDGRVVDTAIVRGQLTVGGCIPSPGFVRRLID